MDNFSTWARRDVGVTPSAPILARPGALHVRWRVSALTKMSDDEGKLGKKHWQVRPRTTAKVNDPG